MVTSNLDDIDALTASWDVDEVALQAVDEVDQLLMPCMSTTFQQMHSLTDSSYGDMSAAADDTTVSFYCYGVIICLKKRGKHGKSGNLICSGNWLPCR